MITPLILLLIGVLVGALYAGLETGIYSVSRIRIQLLSEKKNQARKLSKILHRPQELVTSTLIGINLSHYICSVSGTALLVHYSFANAEILSTLLLTPLLFIFAEIIPKEIFRRHADTLMCTFRGVLKISYLCFYPLIMLLLGLGKFWGYLLNQNPVQFQLSKQRIRLYFIEKGGLSQHQSQLAGNIFRLEEHGVIHVMQPLKKAIMLEKKTPRDQVLQVARTFKLKRYPIYENNPANIIGVIHIYDILFEEEGEENFSLEKYLRKFVRIPAGSPIPEALNMLQKGRTPLGIVLGKDDKAVGIVTLKDLLEEVVGVLKAW